MKKNKTPSETQAKRIARRWADNTPIPIMKAGRDNSAPYNDPTTLAIVKAGWVVSSGLPYVENGFVWEPHHVSDAGIFALEVFLMKRRLASPSPPPPRSRLQND